MAQTNCVLIRTDGNAEIASGHLMRCLSIARALVREGSSAVFAVADGRSRELLESFLMPGEHFQVEVLGTDYRRPDTEPPLLAAMVKKLGAGCALVDSYFITARYLEALGGTVKTAYIDDMEAFDCPAALVINYDAQTAESKHPTHSGAGKMLLGLRYVPLRLAFADLQPHTAPNVRRMLISTGGTDDTGAAAGLLRELLRIRQTEGDGISSYAVLAGPLHRQRRQLEALADSHPEIELLENVQDMASLMAGCDLAVSAGGTTLYELCAAGVPAVSFTMADNQIPVALGLQRLSGLPYAGDIRSVSDLPIHLARLAVSLSEDYPARRKLAQAMHELVDGKGALRIARELIALYT